jgi:CRISPR-associated protein Cas5d
MKLVAEMKHEHILTIELWGDRALYTRPEYKAERVSYDVPTLPALEGAIDSIYWKPEFDRQIIGVEILQRGTKDSWYGNYVKSKAGRDLNPIDIVADRTQRMTTFLKDVRYRVHVQLSANDRTDDLQKHFSIFAKRIDRGRCFQRPYLGVREFPAYFSPPTETPPTDWTEELGFLLTGFDRAETAWKPVFSVARVNRGHLHWEALC